MQKIKIGHRANFRDKDKCFLQLLFPVRAILRCLSTSGVLRARLLKEILTNFADTYIFVIVWMGTARARLKTLSSLLKSSKYTTFTREICPRPLVFILLLVIIKDYVGAFDRVTAAQCRGLSCEIEARCASQQNGAQTLKSHGITIDTCGTDLKRLEWYAFSRLSNAISFFA